MTIKSSSSHFLQEMSYPPYCIQPLKSWGMIAVGGGGGTAKTGVANAVDLKWIYLNQSSDPGNSKCSIQNVNSFSQHDSVMRMVSLHKNNDYLILALNRHLKVILLKPSQRDLDHGSISSRSSPLFSPNSHDFLSLPPHTRRRRSSSASDIGISRRRSSVIPQRPREATVEAIGNDSTIEILPSSVKPTSYTTSFIFPHISPTMANSNIYTVPIPEEEYINALTICPTTQSKLFVG